MDPCWDLNHCHQHPHQRGSCPRASHQHTCIQEPPTFVSPRVEEKEEEHHTSPNLSNGPSPRSNGSGSTSYNASYARPWHRRSLARSLSNPFPALLSGLKKKDKIFEFAIGTRSSSDLSGDDLYLTWSSKTPRAEGDKVANSDPSQTDDMKDFISGSCMTCGSTMRWPKDVDVFKCSICVTINDLMPLGFRKAGERRPLEKGGHVPTTIGTCY